MPNSFSISGSSFTSLPEATLREQIRGHTGSDAAAMSILRSIERFGADPSIQRFEMTPKASARSTRSGGGVAWSVTAVRPTPPPQG